MPEDLKKTQNKGKHEAKEQRKPRQQRPQTANKPERKPDKKVEEPKVPAPTQPVHVDPGPEFYKNLKRETDEILKITEEANAKYKKKEIQSNWSKYEMPIESYEDEENLGADYETLLQASMSVGGHFQFKHEKSWDINTGPSLYDKYFDIDMEHLATAISTIPFYERNEIELSIFTETDVTSMNNRTMKYKRKYYNDKSYTTPELETQEAILNKVLGKSKEKLGDDVDRKSLSESDDIILEGYNTNTSPVLIKSIDAPITTSNITENSALTNEVNAKDNESQTVEKPKEHSKVESDIDDIDTLLEGVGIDDAVKINAVVTEVIPPESQLQNTVPETIPKEVRKPVIESPEDLEKWLDDFLDD